MFASLKLYIGAAILIALLGGLAYAHHTVYTQGEAAQKAKDAKPLAQAKADQAAAEAVTQQYVVALNLANAQANSAQEAAKAQQAQAAQSVQAAQANAADADKALKTWTAKYAAALRDPACSGLQETLCADATSY